jgi:bifunctional non-homologous end joining protein LigD
LATSIEKVPGGRWIHEIKFDGYRVQLHLVNEGITRRGNDWTKRFKKIADGAFLVNAASAIIDGEVVVPSADGTTDFSVLQNELKGRSRKILMVAFGLLYLNGYDLRKLPLRERKAAPAEADRQNRYPAKPKLRDRRRRNVQACLYRRPRGRRTESG